MNISHKIATSFAKNIWVLFTYAPPFIRTLKWPFCNTSQEIFAALGSLLLTFVKYNDTKLESSNNYGIESSNNYGIVLEK